MLATRARKGLALLLSLTMCVSLLGTAALAVDPAGGAPQHAAGCGYQCAHAHDATCGYAAAVEGKPCEHVHDASCGWSEGAPEIPCTCTDQDGDEKIDHVEGCTYTPAVPECACTHVHDAQCGYLAAVEGTPCTHDCAAEGCLWVCDEGCPAAEGGAGGGQGTLEAFRQAAEAIPEKIGADNLEAAKVAIEAARSLYDALTEPEKVQAAESYAALSKAEVTLLQETLFALKKDGVSFVEGIQAEEMDQIEALQATYDAMSQEQQKEINSRSYYTYSFEELLQVCRDKLAAFQEDPIYMGSQEGLKVNRPQITPTSQGVTLSGAWVEDENHYLGIRLQLTATIPAGYEGDSVDLAQELRLQFGALNLEIGGEGVSVEGERLLAGDWFGVELIIDNQSSHSYAYVADSLRISTLEMSGTTPVLGATGFDGVQLMQEKGIKHLEFGALEDRANWTFEAEDPQSLYELSDRDVWYLMSRLYSVADQPETDPAQAMFLYDWFYNKAFALVPNQQGWSWSGGTGAEGIPPYQISETLSKYTIGNWMRDQAGLDGDFFGAQTEFAAGQATSLPTFYLSTFGPYIANWANDMEFGLEYGFRLERVNEGGNVPVTPTDPTTPDEPEEEIPEEDVPQGELPGDVTIDEEQPPQGEGPEETEINEGEPPLADAPETGDSLTVWITVAALSGLGLVALAVTGRKGKEETH